MTKQAVNSPDNAEANFTVGRNDDFGDKHQQTFSAVMNGETVSGSFGAAVVSAEGPDFSDFVRTPDFSQVSFDARQRGFDEFQFDYVDKNRGLSLNSQIDFKTESAGNLSLGAIFLHSRDGGGQESAELSFQDFNDKREQIHAYANYRYDIPGTKGSIELDYQYLFEDNFVEFSSRNEADGLPPPEREFIVNDSDFHRIRVQYDHDFSDFNNYLIVGGRIKDINIAEIQLTNTDFSGLDPFRNQNEWAVYIQDQQKFLDDRISLTLGWRYDDNSSYGDANNLRGAALVEIVDGFSIRAGYGEAFRGPTVFELFSSNVTESLSPALIESWEAGFSLQPNDYLSLQAVYFQNDATNLIEEARGIANESGDVTGGLINGGSFSSEGLETTLRYTTSDVEAYLWYTYTDTEDNLNVGENKVGGQVYVPVSESFAVSAVGKYVSSYNTSGIVFDGSQQLVSIREYRVLNLNFLGKAIKLGEAGVPIDLTFSVNNIFDRDNRFANVRGPNPIQFRDTGRTFWLTAGVALG